MWLPSIIVSPSSLSVSIGVLIIAAHNKNEIKKNNNLLCTPGPCIILQCSILHFTCQLTFRRWHGKTYGFTYLARLDRARRDRHTVSQFDPHQIHFHINSNLILSISILPIYLMAILMNSTRNKYRIAGTHRRNVILQRNVKRYVNGNAPEKIFAVRLLLLSLFFFSRFRFICHLRAQCNHFTFQYSRCNAVSEYRRKEREGEPILTLNEEKEKRKKKRNTKFCGKHGVSGKLWKRRRW